MIAPKLKLLTLHVWIESEADVSDIGSVIDMEAFGELVWATMEVAESLNTYDKGSHVEKIRIVLESHLGMEDTADVGHRDTECSVL
ncbi:hypothetical protein EST38_g6066 [Candolleomyces aberdarensis]|uniref:Uncharacterized protein n=1 Tax=Candolleomyces aberdarensis TaxID=2316362 RepID=A0A4Q2DLY1_9AGAR|nr:hypothetical protein EST38_g6066 [Candolleomyces aberdarensis]